MPTGKSFFRNWFTIRAALVIISALTLFAQTIEAKSDEKEASSVVVLDPVVVTAQKQEENVQEIPVAVTVLDSIYIEDLNPSLPSAGQKTNKKEEIVDESTCNLLILLSGGF